MSRFRFFNFSYKFLIYATIFNVFLVFFFYQRPSGNDAAVNTLPTITFDISQVLRVINATKTRKTVFRNMDRKNDYMNECILPDYDYSDPSIKEFIDLTFDPDPECDNTTKPLTELANGVWRITGEKEGRQCFARCFEENGDLSISQGYWMGPGPVDCEFLEAVCWENGEQVYGYIHTQIVPKPREQHGNDNQKKDQAHYQEKPNVFIFMLDSLSHGMAKRSLPKTLSYLKHFLESVEFPFVNKVGENSRPNGIPLFFGQLFEEIRGDLYGGKNIVPDWNDEENCPYYVDDKLNIFKEFKEHGYVTMDEDDWFTNVINWGGCKGYRYPPSDHHMHPFQLAYFQYAELITRQHLKSFCRRMHNAAMEYFQQFVDAYPDRPKFSFMWDIDHGHDFFNGYAPYDEFFMNLMKRNQKLMDDSFVIVLGDHGSRNIIDHPEFMNTEIFEFERNNPFLSISVPKKYRKSPILKMMKENAKKLQTMFDTRATIMDILKFQPQSKFTDTQTIAIPNERGHSYFRRPLELPRTCGYLPIQPEYCICQVEKIPVRNSKLEIFFGTQLIQHINQILSSSGKSWTCETHEFHNVTNLVHFGRTKPHQIVHNYQLSVRTSDLKPAHFDTFLSHNIVTNELKFGQIMRLDRYGETGMCLRDTRFEKMCYCKKVTLWDFLG